MEITESSVEVERVDKFLSADEISSLSKKIPRTPPTPKSARSVRTPVDGVKLAFDDFISILYQSHGRSYDEQVRKFESSTGLKREQGVYCFGFLLAIYLIMGRSAEFVCNIIGYAFPAYKSVQAVRSNTTDDDTHWLIYWIVFATFSIVDFFAQSVCSWFPPYWLLKAAFLVYLYLPQTEGAIHVYEKVIDPLYNSIDKYIQKKIYSSIKIN
ncbi:unnamed protein product [Auanema sp. JU1783]|nr:unnamed protein product [Auanema sp. JU1783]